MTCPLCKLWEMMPYHKRWSTPTTPQECEGAMIAGFWAAKMQPVTAIQPEAVVQSGDEEFDGPLCDRHQAVMVVFNNQHAERRRIAAEMAVRVAAEHDQRVQGFLTKMKELAKPPPPPQPVLPPPVIPSLAAAPVAPAYAHPQPAAPSIPVAAPPPVVPTQVVQPSAPTKFPCPLCGKPTFNGDVHTCAEPEPPPEEKKV